MLQHVETLLGDEGSRQKLLLFGHHAAVLDAFEAKLRGRVGVVRIDGKTRPEDRHVRR